MSIQLPLSNEQRLQQMVDEGFYPSVQAALDAAVEALHEKYLQIPDVPEEHRAQVQEALDACDRGEVFPLTESDWEELRQRVRDAAARQARTQ